jgi:hypothetical protein
MRRVPVLRQFYARKGAVPVVGVWTPYTLHAGWRTAAVVCGWPRSGPRHCGQAPVRCVAKRFGLTLDLRVSG